MSKREADDGGGGGAGARDKAAKTGLQRRTQLASPELAAALVSTSVLALKPANNTVYVVERSDKLVDVWHALIARNVLSFPVLQQTKHKYYGMIDVADIALYVIAHFGDDALRDKTHGGDARALMEQAAFADKVVNDVIKYPLSRKDVYHPIAQRYSLFTVFEALAREDALQRVPIVDEVGGSRRVVNLISQSAAVRWLAEHVSLLGAAKRAARAADIVGAGQCDTVLTVRGDTPAVDAFRLMRARGVTGVGVVDDAGALSAVLSLRDLAVLAADAHLFHKLFESVDAFIADIAKTAALKRPRRLVTVAPDDTFETVVRTLADKQVHRVYVVEPSSGAPQRCIALRDVLLDVITSWS